MNRIIRAKDTIKSDVMVLVRYGFLQKFDKQ
jgi:hypothetical protein